MNLLHRFVNQVDFASQEDFEQHFSLVVPEAFNYGFDVVDEMARLAPDQTAIVWTNPQGEEHLFTFRDVMVQSNKTANYLRSLGIGKGDPVMLILKRHYQFWFTLVALHKLGAVAIPATHQLMVHDLVYRNQSASVKAIICTGEGHVAGAVEQSLPESPTVKTLLMVHGHREGWLDLDAGVAAASKDFARPQGDMANTNDDTMIMFFSSGTTGMPKMVAHSYTYPLGHVITGKYWHNCLDGGLHFTISDTGWGKALWGKIYGQWICGSAVMVYDFDKFVPSEILGILQKYRVTTFCAPPTMYRFMIREDLSQYDFSALTYCNTAGEAMNPEVFNIWKAATGLPPKEGFGQTETTLTVMTSIYTEAKPGCMGLFSPGYKVDIVDEDGAPCEAGQVGEVVVHTENGAPAGMFQGYYRNEQRTREAWHDGLYHTGDTAWRDADGYLVYVGRTDDIIKSSGYRIGPFEVESALMEHPAVLECAITGVPDPIRGQVIKATIVLNRGFEGTDTLKKELQDHVKHTTAPYKYPRVVEFVEELPKTISGKIRRVELRQRDSQAQA